MTRGLHEDRDGVNRGPVENSESLLALGRAIELRVGASPRSSSSRRDAGVEGNSRLTSSVAAVIFVLLAVEGVTIVRIGTLLNEHVFFGVLLIPPVVVKVASTSWRFVKYYSGSPAYRRKGPPMILLRLLGPIVVALTVVVLASGVGLVLLPHSQRQLLFFVHRSSFVLWFFAMAVHVVGHLAETVRLAPRDWWLRTRRQVKGASARQWIVVWSLVAGMILGAMVLPYGYNWFSH